ncbi:PH domain-containing protein [Gordonia zhaorongruii]|uniref:PH domain-containing protein n=1 Tax=Gordonia zhaorongruii TaxID=2597659 RepID=UPI001046BCF6|nr:PH domain-containing protein [Gordonia zhaorongruii]
MKSEQKEWSTPVAAGVALVGAGIALAAAAAASYTEPPAMVFISVAALGLIVAGAIALIRRPRLALRPGPTLAVRTISGSLELTPDDVERISVLETRRLGARNKQLMLDLFDDKLVVFGRWDLGDDPRGVADELRNAGFTVG